MLGLGACVSNPAVAPQKVVPPPITMLGFRPGITPAEALPDATDRAVRHTNDGVTFRRPLGGLDAELTLRFERQRLHRVDVRVDSAEEAGFLALSGAFDSELGVPEVTRCSNPERPSELLSAHATWRKGALRGEVDLFMKTLKGEVVAMDLAPERSEQGDLVQGVAQTQSCAQRREPQRLAALEISPQRAPSLACRATPTPAILGLEFGRSFDEVQTIMGPLRTRGAWSAEVERDVEGVASRVMLFFFDGCLAVIQVHPLSATREHHLHLLAWAQHQFGPGKRLQCVVTPPAGASRDRSSTTWKTPAITASLRLEPASDCAEEDALLFEVASEPLRALAPRIDFAR